MSDNSSLHIHARLTPDTREEKPAFTGQTAECPESEAPASSQVKAPRRVIQRRKAGRASFGDRLLRNSAIACALLLGILALGNIEAPWAKKASEGVQRALTMHIDLDESIGALQFVKNIMPESALVFMNLSGESAAVRPVAGAITHTWTNLQPWVMFSCAEAAEVRAIADGTVTAVSPISNGLSGILIDHGDGIESLYASLSSTAVAAGETVSKGQALGTADGSVYFEYRSAGESIDPSPVLGL